jgi:SAM-dependent MidA family methyltransferase
VGGIGWREAWHRALYGPSGFYRAPSGPAGHFTTATHGPLGPVLAGALLQLAQDEGCTRIVDVGCGRGELLAQVRRLDPDVALAGVDVVDRPRHLPSGVDWLASPGGEDLPDRLDRLESALVVAHEWLDVVPCHIAEVGDDRLLREVWVDMATGEESLGPEVGDEERAWTEQHWAVTEPDQRVEIGLTRDRAWSGLLRRMRSGVAVAVDYGHRGGERPAGGTLTAYREGVVVAPVPDGTCDLTAHVAMDSLDHDELLDQRTALRGLGVQAATPPRQLAADDPAAYLRALSHASAASSLTARGGFGDFWWAIKRVG